MAWTQVHKTAWNSASANTSHTTSAFPAATAGNLLVIFVNADAVINSFTSGYTQATSGLNFTEVRVYYKIASGGETTVTIGLGNTRACQTLTLEYSGNVASSPLDLANGTTGSSTTPATPSITTTVANTILFAVFAGDDTHTYSALTAGYTQESDQRSTGGGGGAEVSMLVASKIVSATGAQSASITQSGINTAWEACIAAFKMATAGTPAVATLTDDFNDNSLDTAKWGTFIGAGATVTETGQQLQCATPGTNGVYAGVYSQTTYDLTNSAVFVNVPSITTLVTGRTSSLELELDSSNALKMMVDGATLQAQTNIGGSITVRASVTYDASADWWRIRHTGGMVYWEYSASGAPGSWFVLFSLAPPITITALTVKLAGGHYQATAGGTTTFDNLNVPGPGQLALPASDTSVGTWTTDTGATTNLYQAIDEPDFNDTDYIRSVAAPANQVYEVALGAVSDPAIGTGHIIAVRAYVEATGATATGLTTELRQGASALSTPASFTDATMTTAVAPYPHTLSTAQADAITDYGTLRARVTANITTVAPAPQGIGTAQAATTAAVTVPWPTGGVTQPGDIGFLCVERAGGSASPTLTTPAGFVAVPSGEQSTGTSTAGTKMTVFWCRATSTSMPSPVVAASADHQFANIVVVRGCIGTGNPWDVVGGGVKATASTTVSATGVTTTVPNTRIIWFVARDNDANGAVFSAPTNANTTNNTIYVDDGTNSGGGGGFCAVVGTLAAAGASGAMGLTVTSGINAWVVLALQPDPNAGRVRITWVGLVVPAVPVALVPKRWDGSAWQNAAVQRWSGSAWVPATVKRWNGTGWV